MPHRYLYTHVSSSSPASFESKPRSRTPPTQRIISVTCLDLAMLHHQNFFETRLRGNHDFTAYNFPRNMPSTTDVPDSRPYLYQRKGMGVDRVCSDLHLSVRCLRMNSRLRSPKVDAEQLYLLPLISELWLPKSGSCLFQHMTSTQMNRERP